MSPNPIKQPTHQTEAPYAKVPLEILEHPNIGAAAKLVWIAIRHRMGKNSCAWPGGKMLSADTGLSVRTAKRAVSELIKHDPPLLRKIPRNPGQSNNYQAIDPCQNDIPPMSNCHTPHVKMAPDPCQNDIQNKNKELAQGNVKKKRAEFQAESGSRPSKPKTTAGKPQPEDLWKVACDYMAADSLKTEKFRAVWLAWVQHRKEIRKQLTPSTIKLQIKDLEAMGLDRAVACINHGIKQGWTGLYEPGGAGRTPAGRADQQKQSQWGETIKPRTLTGRESA